MLLIDVAAAGRAGDHVELAAAEYDAVGDVARHVHHYVVDETRLGLVVVVALRLWC